jgi:hypothetical protein
MTWFFVIRRYVEKSYFIKVLVIVGSTLKQQWQHNNSICNLEITTRIDKM